MMNQITSVKISIVIAGILGFAAVCNADLKAGLRAYQASDFKTAYKEFKQDKQPTAQYNLGIMYYKGQGVKTNKKEAIRLFQSAATGGDINAQFILGVLYDKGEDISQNQPEAVRWYLKAAERGHVQAQFNVGMMLTNGNGVTKNKEEALKWFKKAAAKGHDYAKKMVTVLEKGMQPAQPH